jgi:hypothetical protein
MSRIILGGAFAALFLSAGCATDPYLADSATLGASGQFGAPAIHMEDGHRKEIMVGSRIARESRENSESVKSISRRGYEEQRLEKPGSSPLDGGM